MGKTIRRLSTRISQLFSPFYASQPGSGKIFELAKSGIKLTTPFSAIINPIQSNINDLSSKLKFKKDKIKVIIRASADFELC